MFVQAIQDTLQYTRPIQIITRGYGSAEVTPGLATLFFVNEFGAAITCKHVAEFIIRANDINGRYQQFKHDLSRIPKDGKYASAVKGLEMKYKYTSETTIQIKNNFIGCVDVMQEITIHQHPKFDLAILLFKGFNNIGYQQCARFLKDYNRIRPGQYLCRLGFPFPEYRNYQFNTVTDDIVFIADQPANIPIFPLDGIITRNIAEQGEIMGIELSTPGLKGQSGGPLFDENGIIYGMQQSTKHLHLGFDIENKEIISGSKKKKVSDYAFLHLGQCIRADIITAFLRQMNIPYYEA